MTDDSVTATAATVRCVDHDEETLDPEKVDALILLLDWPHWSDVLHACERELTIKRGPDA